MGWLVGSSTRTPTRFISIIVARPDCTHTAKEPATEARKRVSAACRREERHHQIGVLYQGTLVVHGQDEGQVPVPLLVVEAVADHEPVGALEPPVLDLDG